MIVTSIELGKSELGTPGRGSFVRELGIGIDSTGSGRDEVGELLGIGRGELGADGKLVNLL